MTLDEMYQQISDLLERYHLTQDQLNFVDLSAERQLSEADKRSDLPVGLILVLRGNDSSLAVFQPAGASDPYLAHPLAKGEFNYRRHLLQWSNTEGAMYFYPVDGRYVEMANNFWYEHMTNVPSGCTCKVCAGITRERFPEAG